MSTPGITPPTNRVRKRLNSLHRLLGYLNQEAETLQREGRFGGREREKLNEERGAIGFAISFIRDNAELAEAALAQRDQAKKSGQRVGTWASC